jgi:peptidyl-prolyl cis-trans isomerase-like 1
MAAPSDAPRVALSTSAGDFVVELYDKEAPQTCDNFMELAKRGYYDGTKVSRGVGGERWRRRRRGRRRERREF